MDGNKVHLTDKAVERVVSLWGCGAVLSFNSSASTTSESFSHERTYFTLKPGLLLNSSLKYTKHHFRYIFWLAFSFSFSIMIC